MRGSSGAGLLVMLCLLESGVEWGSRVACAADDSEDREVDPPYAGAVVGGFTEGDDGYRRPQLLPMHRPPFPVVLPLIPVSVVTPISLRTPDEVGDLDGLPPEERMRKHVQLMQEESLDASDQLIDAHAPMLHEDSSLIGRGAGVGVYHEADILEPRDPTVAPRRVSRNRSAAAAPASNATTASSAHAIKMRKNRLILGACIMALLLTLISCILIAILMLLRRASTRRQATAVLSATTDPAIVESAAPVDPVIESQPATAAVTVTQVQPLTPLPVTQVLEAETPVQQQQTVVVRETQVRGETSADV